METPEIKGRKFSILGGARSGVAVARLLKQYGATVFLSDKAPAEKMAEAVAEMNKLGIPHELGGHTRGVLDADVLVLSPGVPSETPVVIEARKRSIRVVSEVEVASWFCLAPIVAVTGTNGKTTTTTLIGRMFEDAKQTAVVAGNIGTAFSQVVETLNDKGTAVLEISSFQLDHIEKFKPKVSVLLNVTPDHLDRYENSFDKYIASKSRIFMNQRAGDCIVYNYDDPVTRTCVEQQVNPAVTQLPFSSREALPRGAWVEQGAVKTLQGGKPSDVVRLDEISIRGGHNLYNAMAAILATKAMDISTASIRSTLRNFKGVEHRLELVRERNGVLYINDSKATNVDSVWYALQSFPNPIVLLLGGRDKGNDYSRLVPLVKAHVKAIVAIGESADKVVNAFQGITPVKKAAPMEEAVRLASSMAVEQDIVLLSPACASFDWFENYEHRGRVFKEAVNRL